MKRLLNALGFICAIGMIFSSMVAFAEADAAKAPVEAKKALTTITRADVEALIKLAEKATLEKDLELLGSLMADDAKIIYINAPNLPPRMEQGKTDYLHVTRFGMLPVEKLEITRKDFDIRIEEDGKKATIRNICVQRATIQGKVTETTVREFNVCELRDGKILYVRTEGEYISEK